MNEKFAFIKIIPVIDHEVRKLCTRPYIRHRKGCPNFNKKKGCPPKVKLFQDVYDLNKPIFAVINIFNIKNHIEKMRNKHPEWSYAQLANCLYWQGHERKLLRQKVKLILKDKPGIEVNYCPEAMGVNITKTMANVGIKLEWPPINYVIQVAILAYPII